MISRLAAAALGIGLLAVPAGAQGPADLVQVGPRPYYLVDVMDDGPLKVALQRCEASPPRRSDFSIGHRGAPLQFPEHTRESYVAAARMGAGIVECDVTFTKDRELVCRHAQCDLHTTTNILAVPDLAAKCSVPFTPADPASGRKASAKCCTSDLTLAEFKRLEGKMDASDPNATTVEGFMAATAAWRTDLYVPGTLVTHKESIALLTGLGVKFTPELKAAEVPMPFAGSYTQAAYAQQLIDEYKAAGVDPAKVFAQSFNREDILYWIRNEPAFGAQAVFLDDRDETVPGFDPMQPATWSPSMRELATQGIKIVAPPIWMLLTLDAQKAIVPSAYAREAKAAGLDIITWSLERSGPLAGGGGWYYQSIKDAVRGDGAMLKVVDVLAKDVGVRGIFSDWPATTTFYASCMGLK
jgi:glycerophosphoryl diester phosphodiesterase